MASYLQVTTATPSRTEAERLARLAVESRLAAAVHVIGPIHSTYRWRAAVHERQEWLCVARTVAARRADRRRAPLRGAGDLRRPHHPRQPRLPRLDRSGDGARRTGSVLAGGLVQQ